MLLRVRGLAKSYDDEVVFDGVDFELAAGQSVAVTGPSGEGKSTLLSMLGLLLTPTAGSLEVGDRNVAGLPDAEMSHIRSENFGFVFQHTQLIGSLRAVDNVLVPALIAGRRGLSDRTVELLVELGLRQRLYHFPHQLSVGQKRRVALARALLLDPPIVFADEPTNDLDAPTARLVADRLFSLPNESRALVIVTHDEELAHRADRLLRLYDGHLLEESL